MLYDIFLNTLFTLAGVFFGRLMVLARPRADMDQGTLKADLELLANEIRTRDWLELEYLKALAAATGRTEEAVQADVRAALKAGGYPAPELNQVSARQILEKWVG